MRKKQAAAWGKEIEWKKWRNREQIFGGKTEHLKLSMLGLR